MRAASLHGLWALITGAAAAALLAPAQAATHYKIESYTPPSGYQLGELFAINNAGAGAGQVYPNSGPGVRLVSWSSPSKVTFMHGLGDEDFRVFAINNLDEPCGYAVTKSGIQRAVVWDDGTPTQLTPLGNASSTRIGASCLAINDDKLMVGWSNVSRNVIHATRWYLGEVYDLGALGSSNNNSAATAISRNQLTVGYSQVSPGVQHAVLWEIALPEDLGTLHGGSSTAMGVNDAGQVVGATDLPIMDSGGQPLQRAFLWQSGVMTDLGSLPGWEFSTARSINASGQIIGSAGDPLDSHAVLWQNGTLIDLNVLLASVLPAGTELTDGYSIADSGRMLVAGFRWVSGQQPEAPFYLITPLVPTHVVLVSAANPIPYGSSVRLTATVTSDTGVVSSGTVTFLDGSKSLGKATLDSNGRATLIASGLALGTNSLTASYAEHDVFDASVSPVLQEQAIPIILPIPHSLSPN